jgi:ribonuclease G
VLVEIVEPHMYDVDDAVAKIDGYIISIRGGGKHVGKRRLVRIEEVGRTSATAALVDQPGDQQDEDGDKDASADKETGDDDVQSPRRRRGRRGGRRRSRAKAGTAGDGSASGASE